MDSGSASTQPGFSRLGFSDGAADKAIIESLSGKDMYNTASALRRRKLQTEALEVANAYQIYSRAVDLVRSSDGRFDVDEWDKAGLFEVSAASSITVGKARRRVELGMSLSYLPAVQAAYLDGEFEMSRVGIICDALCETDIDIRGQIEPLALELAGRATADRTLRAQITELVILFDPEAAAKQREEVAARAQNVRVRPELHGHSWVDATVPAEVGAHIAAFIRRLIAQRVCKNDPRTIGQQRATALAELVGTPGVRLACECGSCEWGTDDAGTESFSEDDVIAESGASVADTPIAPEPAEAEDLPGDPADISSDHPEPPMPPGAVLLLDPAHEQVPWIKGYGPVDPEHAASILGKKQAVPDVAKDPPPSLFPGLILGDQESPPVLDLSALANPSLAPPKDPTGHGGIITPTKAMLTYAPSRALGKQIFHSDRTCRYPFCGRPSEECQLDHVVPFKHSNPEEGGFTIDWNLIPLCKPDHDRKHLGIWIPTMRWDRSVSWYNAAAGRTLITYPR